MTQGNRFYAPTASECKQVVSQKDSGETEIDMETSNPYKPRPRRRTNLDRYEPSKGGSAVRQSSPGTKRSQKRATMMKGNTSRVDKRFHAKNVKVGRLTLSSNTNLGIFRKGKTSDPISCPQISYLNFSEMEFLRKEAQFPEVPEDRTRAFSRFEKSLKEFPTDSYSDAFIEKQLLESLGNCRQLSIPYEEYTPSTSNNRFLSIEDLKEISDSRSHTWPKGKSNAMYECPMRPTREFHTEKSIYNRMENREVHPWNYTPDTITGNSSMEKDMFLDICLETVKDFDGDVAMEYLAGLVEAEDANAEADLHPYPGKELRNPNEQISCFSLQNSEKNYPRDKSIYMMAETRNNSSTDLGMTQKPCDAATSFNAPDSWHGKDLEEDIIIGDCGTDIVSGLDGGQFGRRVTPVCMTNQPFMPTSTHPTLQHAATEITPHRRFWRCNKLY